MTDFDTTRDWKDDVGFRLTWRQSVSTTEALPNSLQTGLSSDRAQLLDQFAVWINEGGAGREPSR